jgi:uncharacterized repeat protein (TIGR03843 family)
VAEVLTGSDALDLLARGELEVAGRIVDASNATLLATVTADGVSASCVYKPVAGERPLWDFPRGTLALREVASFVLSDAAGFDVVPPTVLREGPFGAGSIQLWVEPCDSAGAAAAEPGAGLVDVVAQAAVPQGWCHVLDAYGGHGEPVALVHADDERLARMAVFDVLANNADRKGGHVLRGPGEQVLGVDHGLTFHVDNKLRTVLWGWAGQRLPEALLEPVEQVAALLADGRLADALAELVAPAELEALRDRTGVLLRRRRFPEPEEGRPLIPWPPF